MSAVPRCTAPKLGHRYGSKQWRKCPACNPPVASGHRPAALPPSLMKPEDRAALARDTSASPDRLEALARMTPSTHTERLVDLAWNSALPAAAQWIVLERSARNADALVRLSRHPSLDEGVLRAIWDVHPSHRCDLADSPSLPADLLASGLDADDESVRAAIARRTDLDPDTYRHLAADNPSHLRKLALARNEATPRDTLRRLVGGGAMVAEAVLENPSFPDEDVAALAGVLEPNSPAGRAAHAELAERIEKRLGIARDNQGAIGMLAGMQWWTMERDDATLQLVAALHPNDASRTP